MGVAAAGASARAPLPRVARRTRASMLSSPPSIIPHETRSRQNSIAGFPHKPYLACEIHLRRSIFVMENALEPPRSVGLSIIICTYNRADFLAELLSTIAPQQAWLDLEVLVIDNNCADHTRTVVSQSAEVIHRLRRVPEPRQGLSFARNRGVCEAEREYLLFLDDDALLPEGFLKRLSGALRDHRPDLFGGPVLPRFESELPSWFPPEIETRWYADVAGFSPTATLSGGNFGARRDVLQRLGPFDTALGMRGPTMAFGEDREMVERYRRCTRPDAQRLYYDPQLAIEHRVGADKLSRDYQLRRSYETARARERVFVASRVRGPLRSRLLALVRLLLAPLSLGVTLLRGGFSDRALFLAAYQSRGLAGRLSGAFSSAPTRS